MHHLESRAFRPEGPPGTEGPQGGMRTMGTMASNGVSVSIAAETRRELRHGRRDFSVDGVTTYACNGVPETKRHPEVMSMSNVTML